MTVFGVISCAFSNSEIPFHYLGEDFNKIRGNWISVTTDGDYEDENDDGIVDERWLVIDGNRQFITIQTAQGVVSQILISDPLFKTDMEIGVGSKFHDVVSAYPDAVFKNGTKQANGGIYDLVIDRGRLVFWFDSRVARQNELLNEKIKTRHKVIAEMVVIVVQIKS